MEFNEKIKELRIQRGLTLQQVGDVVGVGKSTVRKWENGDIKNMGRDKIELLAHALGVDPAYLMGWEEDSAQEKLNEIGAELTAQTPQIRMVSGNMEHLPQEYQDRIVGYVQALVEAYKNDISKEEG